MAAPALSIIVDLKKQPELRSLIKSPEPHAGWKTDSHGMGGLAQFERELTKIRTSEGRERANVPA
jgi:hypothetical protein